MTKTFQGVKDFTFRRDLKTPTAHPESFIKSEHAAVSQPVAFSSLPNSRHCSFRLKQSCYCVQHQIKHSVPTYASSHPDSPASWLVKQLGRWAAMGKRGGEAPCWAAAGRWAVVWILGIPGPQSQDVCTGHDVHRTLMQEQEELRVERLPVWQPAALTVCQPLFVSQANFSRPHGGQEASGICLFSQFNIWHQPPA